MRIPEMTPRNLVALQATLARHSLDMLLTTRLGDLEPAELDFVRDTKLAMDLVEAGDHVVAWNLLVDLLAREPSLYVRVRWGHDVAEERAA